MQGAGGDRPRLAGGKLRGLKAAGVPGYAEREMDEDEVDEVWGEFRALLAFYHRAEKANLPVICTISH